MKTYREPARDIPVTREADVIVVGGGAAGLAAAVASARNGAKTTLVEQFGYLGGTATASLMACINGFRNQVEPDATQVVRGIAEEIVLELKRLGGLASTSRTPSKGGSSGAVSSGRGVLSMPGSTRIIQATTATAKTTKSFLEWLCLSSTGFAMRRFLWRLRRL